VGVKKHKKKKKLQKTPKKKTKKQFVYRPRPYGITTISCEAFDPGRGRRTNEGGRRMYWGLFDASRNAKFG